MSVIQEPNSSSIICATSFPIPKSLTEYSESATPTLSCPNNPFFLSEEKTGEEELLAKLLHISAFLSSTDERPRFDTMSVFLFMFFAQDSTMKHSPYIQFYKNESEITFSQHE